MNLANSLTLVRIFLVPIFMIILFIKIPYGKFIAAAVFILAASTDGLDGYIARKKNQVTRLGKFMDPLADKLLVSAALISLVELGEISAWIAVIIIGREFAVTGLRAIAAAEGIVISASHLGKYKTVSQIVAISAMFLENYPFSLWEIPFGQIAMGVALFFTIWSGVDYFWKARALLKAGGK
ncbi:MAG: CDP-diacylglycerol--glycerol-3-phosphate 3-phosphatidyltransferase [Thermincolia bacterium]